MADQQDARTSQHPASSRGALEEVTKVKETAERLANGNYPDDADHIRVLAGLVHQLAEQVERLAGSPTTLAGTSRPAGDRRDSSSEPAENARHDVEVMLEEDMTPGQPPAQPLNDRTQDQG